MSRSKTIKKPSLPTFIKKTYKKNGLMIEKFGKKKHYVLYERGIRLESIKTSAISKLEAMDRAKMFMTFKKGFKREATALGGLKDTTVFTYTGKAQIDKTGSLLKANVPRPKLHDFTTKGGENVKLFQYVVQYDDNGVLIAGRSQMFNREKAKSIPEMRERAWNNFYARLSAYETYGNFDNSDKGSADNGKAIFLSMSTSQRNRISEGFVTYRS